VLGDAEGEFEVRSSASVGARFVTTFSVMSSTTALSRLCTKKPPATVFAVNPSARGSGNPPASNSRRFRLVATIAMASSVASGAMITSVKISVMARAASAIQRPVERERYTKGEVESHASALRYALTRSVLSATPQGLACLTMTQAAVRAGFELGDAFISRVGIVDVVIGQFLALQLPRGGDAGAPVGRTIECGSLMRVLAIAERLNQPSTESAKSGAAVLSSRANQFESPHRRRGAGVGFGGETPPQRKPGCALMGRELVEHGLIVRRFDDHRDVVVGFWPRRGSSRARRCRYSRCIPRSRRPYQPWPRTDRD